ncbi:MAG: ArsR/SmtB family transcription factor [Phycisphaerae bacterium]
MGPKPKAEQSQAELCELFRLLSDQKRLQILLCLADSDCTVMEICSALDLPQPTISHHLGLLRMNRLIINKRQGKKVQYSLSSMATGTKTSLHLHVPPYTVSVSKDR